MKLINDKLILVIGGTGAQGRAVVKALVEPSSDGASSPETPTIPKSKPNSITRISNWCEGHLPTSPGLRAFSETYGVHTLTQTASPSVSERRPIMASASLSLLPVFPH